MSDDKINALRAKLTKITEASKKIDLGKAAKPLKKAMKNVETAKKIEAKSENTD